MQRTITLGYSIAAFAAMLGFVLLMVWFSGDLYEEDQLVSGINEPQDLVRDVSERDSTMDHLMDGGIDHFEDTEVDVPGNEPAFDYPPMTPERREHITTRLAEIEETRERMLEREAVVRRIVDRREEEDLAEPPPPSSWRDHEALRGLYEHKLASDPGKAEEWASAMDRADDDSNEDAPQRADEGLHMGYDTLDRHSEGQRLLDEEQTRLEAELAASQE